MEHATLKILARKYDDKTLAGHSNPTGFFLFGDMTTEDIRSAIREAMTRLRAAAGPLRGATCDNKGLGRRAVNAARN